MRAWEEGPMWWDALAAEGKVEDIQVTFLKIVYILDKNQWQTTQGNSITVPHTNSNNLHLCEYYMNLWGTLIMDVHSKIIIV